MNLSNIAIEFSLPEVRDLAKKAGFEFTEADVIVDNFHDFIRLVLQKTEQKIHCRRHFVEAKLPEEGTLVNTNIGQAYYTKGHWYRWMNTFGTGVVCNSGDVTWWERFPKKEPVEPTIHY